MKDDLRKRDLVRDRVMADPEVGAEVKQALEDERAAERTAARPARIAPPFCRCARLGGRPSADRLDRLDEQAEVVRDRGCLLPDDLPVPWRRS